MAAKPERDSVDRFRKLWRKELPDVDTSPMETVGRINRFARFAHESISATFAEFGIDRGEFDVISTLRRSGPPYRLTPTALYQLLMLTSGGVTHRLQRLEKRGLIVREPSPDDGRVMTAGLTRKGYELVEASFREDMKREQKLLAPLNARERRELGNLLRKLLMQYEAPPDTAGVSRDPDPR